MKKLFLIPLMLLVTLMLTAACSEDEALTDGQEQTTPGEDDGEEGNEGNNEEGGNMEGVPSGWRRPSSPHWIAI